MLNNMLRNTILSLGLVTLVSLSANAESFTKGKIKLPFRPEVSIAKVDLDTKSKTNLTVKFNIAIAVASFRVNSEWIVSHIPAIFRPKSSHLCVKRGGIY